MSEAPELYCTFRSTGRLFGVPVLDVKEVTTETKCTKIPHSPHEVLGFVNIRGHIFLALNLAALLAFKNEQPNEDSQLVIFKPIVGPAFGIVVDQVGDIVAVSSNQIEAFAGEDRAHLESNERGSFVSHMCKLDGRLMLALDPRKFLPYIERSITALQNT